MRTGSAFALRTASMTTTTVTTVMNITTYASLFPRNGKY